MPPVRGRVLPPPSDPNKFSSGPIGTRGHHACHGVRKSVLHSGVWLFATEQAIQPVDHVRRILIPYFRWRKGLVSGKQDILHSSLAINTGVLFVISLLFHHLPSRTALASVVDHGGFLSHDPRKAGCIIAKLVE